MYYSLSRKTLGRGCNVSANSVEAIAALQSSLQFLRNVSFPEHRAHVVICLQEITSGHHTKLHPTARGTAAGKETPLS